MRRLGSGSQWTNEQRHGTSYRPSMCVCDFGSVNEMMCVYIRVYMCLCWLDIVVSEF